MRKEGFLLKNKFKFNVSRGEEQKRFDFSNPDMAQVSQIFNDAFGDTFSRLGVPIPEGCTPCRPCEGTGRVIKIKTHLLGTSKKVTGDPCPHCGGKGYLPKDGSRPAEQ